MVTSAIDLHKQAVRMTKQMSSIHYIRSLMNFATYVNTDFINLSLSLFKKVFLRYDSDIVLV